MTDLIQTFSAIRRPRLLIRAARLGQDVYRSERDLGRLLGHKAKGEKAVEALLEHEDRMETSRVAGDATYSIARHVEVLIALMAECRWLKAPCPGH